MTALAEHQFEILPDVDATDGFVFGIGAGIGLETFDSGEQSWLTQDGQNTRRGNKGFGRDVPESKNWSWESHTDQDTVKSAVDILDLFAAAWSPDEVQEPGWQTAIRYQLGGRTRRVFGRPRRFAAPPSNLILGGYVPISHDFDLFDSYTYDDVESSAQILYASGASDGGIVLPAVLPAMLDSSEGTGNDQLTVLGTKRAYPVIRFNGGYTNPGINTGDWSLNYSGSIAVGDWIEVDCRPWALTVRDNHGASRVSGLDRRTYLEDCWFAPQSQPQISLSGIASGGGASVTIRWRNTWTSI